VDRSSRSTTRRGWGRSLEWATSSPPPRHNFVSIPRIRSESPAFDLHHPEVAALEMEENVRLGEEKDAVDAPDVEGRSAHLREQMGKNERDEDGR
jgi:cytochrome c oxidase subunit 1